MQCLSRNVELQLDVWLREEPGPATTAHGLLHGSEANGGPVEVPVDGWIDREDAWWYTLHEDSISMPGGEVLSLLWWTEVVQNDLVDAWSVDPLPAMPDKEALRRVVKCLCEDWGYRRARGDRGEAMLIADEPSHQAIALPDHRNLSAAVLRGLVEEAARHKGEHRDVILYSMVPYSE